MNTLAGVVAVVLGAACSVSYPRPGLAQQAGGSEAAGRFYSDPQTERIVNAADAFLATLTDEQKTAVLFEFRDIEQRARWSNLPEGIFERKGLAWGDLEQAQRAALTNLLEAVLGPEGMENVREQMAADDALPAPGRGSVKFGSAYYYVAFLGRPSASSPWMLQYGGHHLAINATVVGPDLALSPSLTGGQPLKFVSEGKPVYIVLEEAVQGAALLDSFTDAQREKAVIGSQTIDLVLGPGKDGLALQPEGLPGAGMNVQQKAQLLALIEARLGIIMNADHRKAKTAEVERNLEQTYFAWWGPAEPLGAAYWRVTGPSILLEFSPQALGGDPTQHAHNIYREPDNEYGAAWAPLE
jgi:hypothetical protein